MTSYIHAIPKLMRRIDCRYFLVRVKGRRSLYIILLSVGLHKGSKVLGDTLITSDVFLPNQTVFGTMLWDHAMSPSDDAFNALVSFAAPVPQACQLVPRNQ